MSDPTTPAAGGVAGSAGKSADDKPADKTAVKAAAAGKSAAAGAPADKTAAAGTPAEEKLVAAGTPETKPAAGDKPAGETAAAGGTSSSVEDTVELAKIEDGEKAKAATGEPAEKPAEGAAAKAAGGKAADGTGADSNTSDSKAADGKAADSTATDVTAADGKAADGKPADGKAAEGKAADATAADGKPVDGKAGDSKAAGGEAAGSTAADVTAADKKAADGKPADGKAADGKAADEKAAGGKKARLRGLRRGPWLTVGGAVVVLLVLAVLGYVWGLGPMNRLNTARGITPPGQLAGLDRITDQEIRNQLQLDQTREALSRINDGKQATVEAYGNLDGNRMFVVIALRGKVDIDKTVADSGATPDKIKKVGRATCVESSGNLPTQCYRGSNTLTVIAQSANEGVTVDAVAPVAEEAFNAMK